MQEAWATVGPADEAGCPGLLARTDQAWGLTGSKGNDIHKHNRITVLGITRMHLVKTYRGNRRVTIMKSDTVQCQQYA